jgi:hypothetical protein
MKNVGTSLKVFLATKMKCAVVFTPVSLAFVSQAFAVLRPLFPGKPGPPFSGEVIAIGDDLVWGAVKEAPGTNTELKTVPALECLPIVYDEVVLIETRK